MTLDQFEPVLEQLGWSMQGLEDEALALTEALSNHFGDAPTWRVQLVLCYTLAMLVCESTQQEYHSSARFYMQFFLYCVDTLGPLFLEVVPPDTP
jgi:hypothetical protein